MNDIYYLLYYKAVLTETFPDLMKEKETTQYYLPFLIYKLNNVTDDTSQLLFPILGVYIIYICIYIYRFLLFII